MDHYSSVWCYWDWNGNKPDTYILRHAGSSQVRSIAYIDIHTYTHNTHGWVTICIIFIARYTYLSYGGTLYRTNTYTVVHVYRVIFSLYLKVSECGRRPRNPHRHHIWSHCLCTVFWVSIIDLLYIFCSHPFTM